MRLQERFVHHHEERRGDVRQLRDISAVGTVSRIHSPVRKVIRQAIREHMRPVPVVERMELLNLVGRERNVRRALVNLVYSGEVVVYVGLVG